MRKKQRISRGLEKNKELGVKIARVVCISRGVAGLALRRTFKKHLRMLQPEVRFAGSERAEDNPKKAPYERWAHTVRSHGVIILINAKSIDHIDQGTEVPTEVRSIDTVIAATME